MPECILNTGYFSSSTDGEKIFFRDWSVSNPKGVLLIVHGMSEHSGRYEEFSRDLAENWEIRVVVPDHRGHGRTACPDDLVTRDLGKFRTSKDIKSMDCMQVMAQDSLDSVRRVYQEDHLADTPLFIFGHSMGSVIARCAMRLIDSELCTHLRGVILSGVPTVPAFYEAVPLMLALKACILLGAGQTTLHEFVMGKFDDAVRKRRKDKTLPKDCVISSDNSQVERFHSDPYCGHSIDLHIWDSLRQTLIKLEKPGAYFADGKQRKFPLLFIAGKEDPICNFSKTSIADAQRMREIGFDVHEINLDGCQHEFLYEKPQVKKTAIDQTIVWITSKL
jgi:alpha-beta hydrolase superfamily lysophospholipase